MPVPVPDDLRSAFRQLRQTLRARRLELGLSQEAVAKAADVRQETVSELENGHKLPSFTTLFRIARALGLEISLRPTLPGD